MVAVVNGSGLGLFGSSLSTLGAAGASGNAGLGRGGDRVYVNSASGNLIVQSQDELLASLGLDLALVRTYNSQGLLNDDNGDNWRLGVHQRVYGLTGTLNTAGSTITKVFGDGREVVYRYDAARSRYVGADGDGAHDTLSNSSGTWTWTNGSSRNTETYDSSGQLTQSRDADGNTTTYAYTGSLLTQITDASGQTTYLDYTGNNLTQIRVVSDGQTQTLTRYAYDASNRLTQVRVDLSPGDNSVADNNVYTTTYTYDGTSKRIASITQKDGSSVAFTYELIEGAYRVKTYLDAEGRLTTLTYTPGSAGSYALNTASLLSPAAGWAGPTVLDSPSDSQNYPEVAFDANGNAVAIWRGAAALYVQTYTRATNTWGPIQNLSVTTGAVYTPAHAVDAQGNAVVAWVQSDGAAYSLWVARRDGTTGIWSAAQNLDGTNMAVRTSPDSVAVAINGGHAVVSWLQSDGTQDDVYAARFSAGAWTTPTLLESNGLGGGLSPSAAIDSAGNAIVLWNQTDGTASSIYVNRYSATTSTWSGASTLESSSAAASLPQISFDDSGNGFAVWAQGADVVVRRYDKVSNTWGTATVLDTGSSTTYAPALAMDGAGNALIAWAQSDGVSTSLYAARYTAGGSWSAAALLETSNMPVSASLGTGHPTVSIAGAHAAVGWLQTNGAEFDLYVARANGASWTAPQLVDTAVYSATQPTVAIDALGNVVAGWQQTTLLNNSAVYFSRYDVGTAAWSTPADREMWSSAPGEPSIRFDAQGNAVALWRANLNVYAQRYDRHLGVWGAVALLNVKLNSVLNTGLSVDAAGNAIAAWTQNDGTAYSTYVSRYDAASGMWSAATLLEGSPAAVSTTTWTIQASATGSYGAVGWLQHNGTTYDYYIARYDGASWTAAELVESGAAGVVGDSLSVDAEGNVIAMWSQSDGTVQNVYVNMYARASGTWSGATLFESSATAAQDPRVVMDAAGNAFAIWRNTLDMYVRRFDRASGTWGAEISVDSLSYSMYAPALSVDAQGNALVAWVQNDGTSTSAFARRYDRTTGWDASPTVLESLSTAVTNTGGSLSASINGAIAAVGWIQSNNLYVSRFNGASWGAAENIENNAAGVATPSVGVDSAGNVGIVWMQANGSLPAVWANRYNNDTRSYYLVPAGATWASIAQALYGTNAVASQLQQALGNPTLAAGMRLVGLPASLVARSTDVQDATGQVTRYMHDADGRVVNVLGPSVNGVRAETAYVYDTQGNVLSVSEDPSGLNRITAFSYDEHGNLAMSRDAAGNMVRRTYTAHQQLLTETRYLAGAAPELPKIPLTTRYVYDSEHHLRFVVSPEGRVTEHRYFGYSGSNNRDGLRQATLTYAGATYSLVGLDSTLVPTETQLASWAATQNLTQLERTDYEYDFRGNISTVVRYPATDAAGAGTGTPSKTRFVYDQRGQLLQKIEARGELSAGIADDYSTVYTYDGLGRLLSTTDWIGGATMTPVLNGGFETGSAEGWSSVPGAIATSAARSGIHSWRVHSDAGGPNLLAQRFAAAPGDVFRAEAYVMRDPASLPSTPISLAIRAYDASGAYIGGRMVLQSASTSVDGWQKLAGVVTVPAGAVSITVDVGESSGTGHWFIDDVAITRPVTTTLHRYDDANRRTITTLANGAISTSVYNRSGELISSSQGANVGAPSMSSTSYAYDAAGRPRMQTDSTGVRQFYFYDEAGRLVAQVDGDGSLIEYVYDRTNRNIKTIRYAALLPAATRASLVDGSGNPANISLSTLRTAAGGNPSSDRITRNVYDAAGALLYSIDESGAVTESRYDGAGQLIDTIEYSNRVTIARAVDEVLPAGVTVTSHANDRRTRFFYSNDGLQIARLDAEGYLTEFLYDAAGHLIQQIGYANRTPAHYWAIGTLAQLRPSADTEIATDPERDQLTYYFYDGQGRQIGVLDAEGYLTETIYDVAGHVAERTRYDYPLTYAANATVASLKAQITAASVRERTVYTYDGVGRVLGETTSRGTASATASVTTAYSYDAVGSLVSSTRATNAAEPRTTQVRYDFLGRVLQELDGEGSRQLIGLTDPTAINNVWDRWGVTYAYDTAGRRISATRRPNDAEAGVTAAQVNVTLYYYDEDNRLRFEINQLGDRVEYRYNAFGQMTDEIRYTQRLTSAQMTGLTGGLVTSALITTFTGNTDGARDARTSYQYSIRGQVSSKRVNRTVSNAEDAFTTYTYNAFGELDVLIESVRESDAKADAAGVSRTRRQEYTYDRRGQLTLTRWDNVAGGFNISESRTYDPFGWLRTVTDARSNIAHRYEYDRLGRQIASTDANSADRTVTTYDAFGRTLSVRDALNNTTTYTYDDANRRMTVTTPEGIAVVTTVNEFGQTLTVLAAANTTTYQYDRNGQLKSVSDGLGAIETRTYDRGGRLVTQTDGRGVVTRFTYDAANHVFERIEDFGAGNLQLKTTYTYDGQGRVIQVDEPGGRRTDTNYRRDGLIDQVTVDPLGLNLRTRYTYDREGHVITVSEGQGSTNPQVTEYRYDTLGRRTHEILDPGSGTNATTGRAYLNLTTRYFYDNNGNLTRKIDAGTNSTWYVYDTDNRVTHTIDALGGVTQMTYDNEDRVGATRRYSTALSAATMTTLGSLNSPATANFTATTNASTDLFTQTIYDRDGRERYTIDAEGAVIERTFDAGGRVTRARAYSQTVPVAAYATEAALTSALTAAGASTTTIGTDDQVTWFAYDARGQSIYTIDGTGAIVRTLRDATGNVVTSTAYATLRATNLATDLASLDTWAATAAVANHVDNRVSRHWYDGAGREVFRLDGEGYLTETRYNDASRISSSILYATKPTISANATTAAVRSNAVVSGFNVARDRVTTSERDAAGRVIRIYDALTSATASSYEEYGYDAVGNRTTTVDARGIELSERDTPWAQSERNRILGYNAPAAAISAVHKALLRSRYTTTRTFDAVGRELTVVDPAGGTSTSAYDALGNVIKLTDARGNSGYFYYDANGRVRYQIDPLGYLTEKRYDALGNVTDELSYGARPTGTFNESTTLAQIPGRIVLTPAKDRHISTTHDRRGGKRVITYYNETNYTEEYQYNVFGQKRSFKDRNDAVFEYRYNSRGDLRREILPQVEVVTSVTPTVVTTSIRLENEYEYNAFGEQSVKREATGTAQQRETRYYYDRDGRQTRVELPSFSVLNRSTGTSSTLTPTVQNSYDAAGNLVLEIGTNGGRTVHYYDSRNLRVATVDAENALKEYDYDAVGNLMAERAYDTRLSGVQLPETRPTPVDPIARRELYYTYDARNLRVQTHTGAETMYSHALVADEEIQNGYYTLPVFTTAAYDANGNLISTTDGNGNVTRFFYDAQGNRELQVDALGYVTRWEYTAQGQVERETKYASPVSQSMREALAAGSVAYNEAAVRSTIANPGNQDNRVTEYRYDALGRKTRELKLSVEYSSVNGSTGVISFSSGTVETVFGYDGNGNLTSQTLPGALGTMNFAYDALGRKTAALGATFDAFNGRGVAVVSLREETRWSYDAHGNASVETLRGQGTTDDRVLRSRYDVAGNLREEVDALGVSTSYDFDVGGTVARKTRNVTDVLLAAHVYRTTYVYDLLGRNTSQQDVEDPGTGLQITRESRDTRYNAHGDIEAKGTAGLYQERYIYDRLGRLFWTNKENGTPRLYVYDANGNAVLEIHSIDYDLRTLPGTSTLIRGPIDVQSIDIRDAQFTLSFYDGRNQLVRVAQPPMEYSPLSMSAPVVTQTGGTAPESPNGNIAASYTRPNLGNDWTGTTGDASTSSSSSSAPRTYGWGSLPADSLPLPSATTITPAQAGYTLGITRSGITEVSIPGSDTTTADGLRRTVVVIEEHKWSEREVTAPDAYTVLVTDRWYTDKITKTTVFVRSAVPQYGQNEDLTTQWTSQGTESTSTHRDITAKEYRITRTTKTDVTHGYLYTAPSSAAVFTPAGTASATWNYSHAEGGQYIYRSYTITAPQLNGLGTERTKVVFRDGYGEGARYDALTISAAGGSVTFNPGVIQVSQESDPSEISYYLNYWRYVDIVREGVVIATMYMNPGATVYASTQPYVTLQSQPYGTSASLTRLNTGTTDSSVDHIVDGTAGREYVFMGAAYTANEPYQYAVYNGGVVNEAWGYLGGAHYRRYYRDEVTYLMTTTTPKSGTGSDDDTTPIAPLSPTQNNVLRRLTTTLGTGTQRTDEIERSQTYNAFGEIETQTDGLNRVTTFKYTHLGQLAARIQPETDVHREDLSVIRATPTTRYYYDEVGQLVGTQDANSELLPTAQKFYNTRVIKNGRVEREFDALGKWKRFIYDALGNKRQEFDELGKETAFLYDRAGQLTQTDRHGGAGPGPYSSDKYEYDAAGNRIRHINGLNDPETYLYDGQNRVLRHTSFQGYVTSYQYTWQAGIAGIGGYETTTSTAGVDNNGIALTDTLVDRKDYFGRIRYHRDMGGHEFTYLYNSAGWLKEQSGTTAKAASGTLLARDAQKITYRYYHNGLIREIDDTGIDSFAHFEYDHEGNRTLEAYSQVPLESGGPTKYPYQFARAEYDELNRLKRVNDDAKFTITYTYDAVGNRRSVRSDYRDLLAQPGDQLQTQEFFYKYDKVNRFTITLGQRGVGGTSVVRGSTGYEIEYDAAGRRAKVYSDRPDSSGTVRPIREEYTYTPLDTVDETFIYASSAPTGGTRIASTKRVSDKIGRVERYYERDGAGVLKKEMSYKYDKDSRTTWEIDETVQTSRERTEYKYLGNGILRTVRSDTANGETPLSSNATVTMTYNYEKWDGYKNSEVVVSAVANNVHGWKDGSSSYQYDSNGHIRQLYDRQADRTITYANNHLGQVLRRYQVDREPNGTEKPMVIRSFYYMNGTPIGDQGTDRVQSRFDYAQALAEQWKKGPSGSYEKMHPQIGDRINPVTSVDFDQNYQPINADYPGRAAQSHVVSSGDTLRSVALAMWGDADLWYLLADANGLNGDETLAAGMRLTVPNVVTNIHNNSGTFRPYDTSLALGDTSPTLPDPPPPPQPKKKGCGVLGTILIAVVAIVATVFTAGVAGGGLAAGSSGVFSTGMAALGAGTATVGGIGAFGAAVVGGAVGSAVSQGVAIALGMQEGFDWKGVAMGAIGAGVTSGLGTLASGSNALGTAIGKFADAHRYAFAALNGAASNALTQGIAVATGLQSSFNWRNVAISAVAAPVAHGFSQAAGGMNLGGFGERFAAGIGGSLVRKAFGSKEDSATMIADAFGSALGDSIVDTASTPRGLRNLSADDRREYERLARQAGLDPRSKEANKTILAIVASRRSADPRQLAALTRDYLTLSGASPEQIDQVLGTLSQNYVLPPGAAPDSSDPERQVSVSASALPAQEQGAVEKYGNVLVGAGRVFDTVGTEIESNPVAKYTLIGLDVASGPAMYAAREGISASPLGDLKRGLEERAAGYVSGRLEKAEYSAESSALGGVGAVGLVELALGGALAAARLVGGLVSKLRAPTDYRYDNVDDFVRATNDPAPNATYHLNGVAYRTDGRARTMEIEGPFTASPVGRNDPKLQRSIGYSGADTDVGFHLWPDSAGGPTSIINVVPGNGKSIGDGLPNLNQGPYATFEKQMRDLAAVPGNQLRVRVIPEYLPGNMSRRPDSISVSYQLNGGGWQPERSFDNKY